MCGITELVSDVLINLCHMVDFGSDHWLIAIKLESVFSAGMSMLFVSPFNSFLCAHEVLQCSGSQQNPVSKW